MGDDKKKSGTEKTRRDPDRVEQDEAIDAARCGCDPTPTEDNPEGRTAPECPEGYPEETPADRPGKSTGGGKS